MQLELSCHGLKIRMHCFYVFKSYESDIFPVKIFEKVQNCTIYMVLGDVISA